MPRTLQPRWSSCVACSNKKRYERGSIEFALPELVVKVDEKGMPYETDYITYDITHQMVEEFMLKANETSGMGLLTQQEITHLPHPRRTADENLRDFALLARPSAFHIPHAPHPKTFKNYLKKQAKHPIPTTWLPAIFGRMRIAAYSAENIGHYGLSLTHYCHFTSPIGRYVDLVAHRIYLATTRPWKTCNTPPTSAQNKNASVPKQKEASAVLKKLSLLQQSHARQDPSSKPMKRDHHEGQKFWCLL